MEQINLWGEAFKIEPSSKIAKKIKDKINNPKTPKIITEKAINSKSVNIFDKIKLVEEEVYRKLGSFKDNTRVICSYEDFVAYCDLIIANGICAIDTETNNSLDYLTCKLMGLCLYTPNDKNVYVPVNHCKLDPYAKDYMGERLSWQVTEEQIREQLQRLVNHNVKFIFHNAKFDYQVIWCTCGIKLSVYWDTMIGARVLDENERAGLKGQYIAKIDSSIEKYDIENLFSKLPYAIFPPSLFALYSATDAFMTFKLYLYQKELFERKENKKLYEGCFLKVEMPCIIPIAEMELYGVGVDFEYAKSLSEYYHRLYDDLVKETEIALKPYQKQVDSWRLTEKAQYHPWAIQCPDEGGKMKDVELHQYPDMPPANALNISFKKSLSEQLKDPISTDTLNSPTQLAILLYDVLGVVEGIGDEESDKKKKGYKPSRGTGEDVLEKIDKKYNLPIVKHILSMRELNKLINTYIDKIPNSVSVVDNRIHTHFNQYGADTGRTSSSDPINLQNIPSHVHSVRPLFKARDGYVFVGSDYSAQEPRLLTFYSKDPSMYKAYLDKKDLYAVIGSIAFKNAYEDNLEFRDGVLYSEGKARRSQCKSILLGIMYGRGINSIAEQLNCSKEDAQAILDSFYDGFSKVKEWIDETYAFVRKYGYVEDFMGRRRRLPDVNLPKYEVSLKEKIKSIDFNPLLFCKGKIQKTVDPKITKYQELIKKAKFNEISDIVSKAQADGVIIKNNGGFIAQAERQCVNARVQGGASSLTKLATIKIFNDEEMKKYDAHLVINVHDELLMECKEEFAEECAKRLSYDMISVASDYGIDVPMKCDADTFKWWYQDQLIGDISDDICGIKVDKKTGKTLSVNPISFEEAIKKYSYLTDAIIETCHNKIDFNELDERIAKAKENMA